MPAPPTAPPRAARARHARPARERCWACAGRVDADEAVCAACGAAPRRRVGALARRALFRAALRAYRRAGYRPLVVGGAWALLAPPRPGPLGWLGRLIGQRPRPLYLAVDVCGWVRDSEGRCTPRLRTRRRLASRWAIHGWGRRCGRPPAAPPGTPDTTPGDPTRRLWEAATRANTGPLPGGAHKSPSAISAGMTNGPCSRHHAALRRSLPARPRPDCAAAPAASPAP